MRILLTGAGGQFGTAFRRVAAAHQTIPTFHHPSAGDHGLDLLDTHALHASVEAESPDWVVHAAAWTDVDGCERDPERAHAVNAKATASLAAAASKTGARLCYISTDYVFDGKKGDYAETDQVAPINVYGKTKLEGERHAAALPDALVARTSAVFAKGKRNFVTWVAGELQQGKTVRAVCDQWVNPTWADDLAEQVLALMEAGERGIYHTAGATPLSRTAAALAVAEVLGADPRLVVPVEAAQIGWLARRPRDTTLDLAKVRRIAAPMPFADALRRMFKG